MTKQEQIEEILEVIKHCGDYTNRDCAECDYRLYGECKNQKQCEAEALYNAGYRKVDEFEKENADLLKACEEQFTFDTTEGNKYSVFNTVRKVFADEVKAKIDELLKEYENDATRDD